MGKIKFKYQRKIQSLVLIIFLIGSVGVFVLGLNAGDFFRMVSQFVASFLVLCAVFTIFFLIITNVSIAKNEKEMKLCEMEVSNAEKELNQVRAQYQNGISLLFAICPEGSRSPTGMRVFVKYFEDGRVHNLNEAKKLFEDYLHREEMKRLAQQQVTNIQVASNYAQQAASDAKAARYAADKASLK